MRADRMVKPTDHPRKPKGITCPTCAVKLRLKRSIPLTGGKVRRVRVCRQCGHKKDTTEQ